MKKRQLNLLDRYYEDQSDIANRKSPLRIYIMVLVASIFIVLAFTLKVYIDNQSLQNDIQDLTVFVNNSTTQAQLEQIKEIDEKIASLDEIEVEVTSLLAVVNYMPIVSKQAFDTIYDYTSSNIEIVNYDYNQNTIYIDCETKYASDFSNFILDAKASDYFREINNYGYAYNSDAKVYTGTIEFILKGGN